MAFGLPAAVKLLTSLGVAHAHGNGTELDVVLPTGWAVAVALLELVIAAGLLTSLWRTTAIAAMSVTATFGFVTAYLLLEGMPAGTCGCFGVTSVPDELHVAMVAAMGVASTLLAFSQASAPQAVARIDVATPR